MQFEGDDRNFAILDVFLTNAGIENIKKGDLKFEGSIEGGLTYGIPDIACTFGLEDVDIDIPNTTSQITGLSLSGHFNSGTLKDFSKGRLDIHEMSATLPGGRLNGKVSVSDFTRPIIDLDIYLKSRLEGFDDIFQLGRTDSLKGSIELKSLLSGKLDLETGFFEDDSDQSIIKFDSVSFKIPELNQVRNLDGRVTMARDTIHFESLAVDYGKSDFLIRGHLYHALAAVFNIEKEISGDLRIQSNIYDFPDFFSWDQRTAAAFPYRIMNVDMIVKLSTYTHAFNNFIVVPKIVFDISHLDAEIEDFLPPVTIEKGVFTLADQDSSLHLNFDRFEMTMAGALLKTNLDFYSPWTDPDWLSIDLEVDSLNPKETFVHWFDDTISGFLDGYMNSKMHLDLVISLDSLTDFDRMDYSTTTMYYTNQKDTFDITNMRFDAHDVSYHRIEGESFLSSLSLDANLSAGIFATNYFKILDADNDITADRGEFLITPNNSQFFDQRGEGAYILKPFADPPFFQIKYGVDQFDVAALFDTFLEDTVLTGRMDLDMNVSFSGQNWLEMRQTLDGHVHLEGTNLTLYGLDLDKLIERFKRSQRFTFADLGAVVLMGPAGILVTKGSEYASILILNQGESSEVLELSSEWNFDDGKVDLADVAFTTEKNRMAAKGLINLVTDTIVVQIALLNEQGCSIFTQSLSGKMEDPKTGKIKVVKSIFAPVTNLVNKVGRGDCEVFYKGRVKHPEK
jgi:hypothetical protein